MVFMGGVASPWVDTEAMVVEWIQSFEEHWRYKGRWSTMHMYNQKNLFAGITITGCCYKFETRPTSSFNPDDFTAISCFSFFTMLMVLLHLA